MDNQSGSCENRSTGVCSSPSVSKMKKQKAPSTLNDDVNSPRQPNNKIRKTTEHQSCHTPNRNRGRPLTQNKNNPQIHPNTLSPAIDEIDIEDPLANFKQLTGTLPSYQSISQIQILSSSDENTQLLELEEQLARRNTKIEKLSHQHEKIKQSNEGLRKFIESEDKIRSELIEKQEISDNRLVVIQEQTSDLSNALSGLQKGSDEIQEMYNNVIMVQAQKIKSMEEQFHHYVSIEEKELTQQLNLEEKNVFIYQVKHQQLEHELNQETQMLSQVNDRLGELEKIICEYKRQHDENMKKQLDYLNEIGEKINTVHEEKFALLIVKDEDSRKLKELVAKLETLQTNIEKRENCKESLKSNVQKLEDEQRNLKTQIQEVKNKNHAMLLEKDSETDDYKKQIQDLSVEYEKTMNKLSEVNSSHQKLLDTAIEMAQINEERKRAVLKKDDEMKKLNEEMIEAAKKNKELSAENEIWDKELIAKKKLLSQIETDFDNCDSEEDVAGQRLSDLRTRLAASKEKLKNKIDEIAVIHEKNKDRELKSSETSIKFEQILGEKRKNITKITKIRENLDSKKDQIESENNRKLQSLSHSSMQCQKAGHEIQIEELTLELDVLTQERSTQELKHKQEIINISETEKKVEEQYEARLDEMKTKIEEVKQLLSANKEQQNKLKKSLKDVQTHNDQTESVDVEEPLNSSKLMGIIFAKHTSIPTSSTPEQTSTQPQEVRFGLDSFSDVSSINGSHIFEDAERLYAKYLENNKTDNAKLNKEDKTD